MVWDCLSKLREAWGADDIFTSRDTVHVPCHSPICEWNVVTVNVDTRSVSMLALIFALRIVDCRNISVHQVNDVFKIFIICRVREQYEAVGAAQIYGIKIGSKVIIGSYW